MRGNNILGIIFAYINGDRLPNATAHRIIASVPFGGRYRFVDFPLSNMVNSGINKVGVITDSNYQSLMDHLGSGKTWDLSRKREGLYLLPPFGADHQRTDGKIESLYSIKRFLQNSLEEYVLLSDSDAVYNMNYKEALAFHVEKQADITIIYRKGNTYDSVSSNILNISDEGKVKELRISEKAEDDKNIDMSLYLIKRTLLIDIVDECMGRNILRFNRGFLFKAIAQLNVYAYEFKGFYRQIVSRESYYEANMELMKHEVRQEWFNPKYPIYTKVKDEMPAKYGLNANVKNSLVADGCIIDGEVEDCVLFRGAVVGKGAYLKNCIVMQDTVIGEDVKMECVITDKNVVVNKGSELKGTSKCHSYIPKYSVV